MDQTGTLQKWLLPFLQADRVDDATTLDFFHGPLDDREVRGIHHHRNPAGQGIALQDSEEGHHGGPGVQHRRVHADIQGVGTRLDLGAGDRERLVPTMFRHHGGEFSGTGDIAPLANDKEHPWPDRPALQGGKHQTVGFLALGMGFHSCGNRLQGPDMFRGGATTATDN